MFATSRSHLAFDYTKSFGEQVCKIKSFELLPFETLLHMYKQFCHIWQSYIYKSGYSSLSFWAPTANYLIRKFSCMKNIKILNMLFILLPQPMFPFLHYKWRNIWWIQTSRCLILKCKHKIQFALLAFSWKLRQFHPKVFRHLCYQRDICKNKPDFLPEQVLEFFKTLSLFQIILYVEKMKIWLKTYS